VSAFTLIKILFPSSLRCTRSRVCAPSVDRIFKSRVNELRASDNEVYRPARGPRRRTKASRTPEATTTTIESTRSSLQEER